MEHPFVEQAIPMIEVNQSGKYELTQTAYHFFRAIDGPIAVVSVAGLYRTGKSYLLNRVLLNRSNGFGVGPTVNPCTKGLWCWGTPIKGTSTDGEPVNIVVIDTEGIGALDEDTTHDTKIFTLAILASSCFVYNSVGSIDENAIQNLSLVVNLTKHIQLKSEGDQDEDGEDPDEISNYFPSFYWVVRDFSLQLQDPNGNAISSKEYLEKALAPQNGFSDDIEEKNRIRRLLTAFFKDRDCYTMIRPLVDEQKLQNLDKMDYDELRPEFLQQAMAFRKRILESVKVKMIQNQKLDGNMYCSVMNSYVTAINEGAVPNIENAWKYMCEEQSQKTLDECYELFIKEMKDGFREFPKPEEDFNNCVNEAEEKALQAFREKAIGDNIAEIFSKLRLRIREQIEEARQQNMKESNEEIRKYILKYIKPINVKLNKHEYRNYPEFEKEVSGMFDRVAKEGPKLSGYKLIYTEAHRKLSSQGAEFLFRDFSKQQEKEKERNKDMQMKADTELKSANEQIQALENEKKEFTVSTDQTILHLRNRVDTLTAQMDVTSKVKDEEQKKMERQFSLKINEQENNKKSMEHKIRQMMDRLDIDTKRFNETQKEWEKDKALLEMKSQHQFKQLEEYHKKQKKMEIDQNVQLNDITSKTKSMAEKHEREREELKNKVKEFEEKETETHEELTTLKEELAVKLDKWEKKEKKLKDDLSSVKKQNENMRNAFDQEKSQLREEIDGVRNESNKDSGSLQAKLKDFERIIKQLTEKSKRDKNMMETENQKLEQSLRHFKQANQKLISKTNFMAEEQEQLQRDLERQLTEQGEEVIAKKMEDMNQQHTINMNSQKETYESIKTELQSQISSYYNSNRDLEAEVEVFKRNEVNMRIEHQEAIETLQSCVDNQKESSRMMEGQKQREKFRIESELRRNITQLENEMEENKETAEKERNQKQKEAEDNINLIRHAYLMEKEAMEKRQKNETTKLKRKIDDINDENDRKLEEEREALQDQIQDLNEKYFNSEEMLKNQSSAMQHEIDMREKKNEELSKLILEVKTHSENKEKEFKRKEEEVVMTFKVEKQKLEVRIEKMTAENHEYEKELMAESQTNEQQKNNIERRQNRIKEAQAQLSALKESFAQQTDKLHLKVSDIEREHHEKTTTYEKQNALLKQRNEFGESKLSETERALQMANQIAEEKMNKYKEEKEAQLRDTMGKLREEKSTLDSKYQKFKTESKEKEEIMKKSLIELNSLKQANIFKITTLESKFQEVENKRSQEVAHLHSELTKYKSDYHNLKSISDEEKQRYTAEIEKLSEDLSDIDLRYQKEKSLLEQQLEFKEKSKNDSITDLQQRIQRLETVNHQLVESKTSEKSKSDKSNYEITRLHEEKYSHKILELSQNLRKMQSEKEAMLKERDNQIKEFREKYESQKMQRQSKFRLFEKRQSEMSENERRLRTEIERLKIEKQSRDMEFSKRETQIKDKNKEKLNELETKVKSLDTERNSNLYNVEKERIKWSMEKEHMKEALGDFEEKFKKVEREKDRFKSDVERLKAEKKNSNRTHSYINSLKTTYEPVKVHIEETNKENSNQQ